MAKTTPSDGSPGHGQVERPLLGLLVAQFSGAFNDNAWKQVVALLAITSAASGQAAQADAALAQLALIVPLVLFSLPAGVLADRVSKRSVILAMKWVELALIVAGSVALYVRPLGGVPTLGVLVLLGIRSALFSPAKYGILPELLPYERLSAGNGLLELWSNVAIILGTAAGGILLSLAGGRPWIAGLALAGLAAAGLVASIAVPKVPAARAEGGLVETVRLARTAIRGDRILRLAIAGQVFVWTVASVVPAPALAYSKRALGLDDWQAGLPLAVLGLGVGAGSLLAGRLSGAKVEYGLLPLGALGVGAGLLAFAIAGPGLVATIALMGATGLFTGLLLVPLNAMLQWRAPADRRGAVIALTNTFAFAGMLAGSALALALARSGITARGTFLGASLAMVAGFLWSLRLTPDGFLRCIFLVLAATLYRIKVLGRANVPREGGALLVPNHVSFADALFVLAGVDRPVRFVVYAHYFRSPILGPILRGMRAIPLSNEAGPKAILRAFREAGQALDAGDLVCIFPEGQITRTGTLQPFQRGMARILRGRTSPIIPVHLDRVNASVFSPTHARPWPERIPLPVTVSFGAPMPADSPLPRVRQAIRELSQDAWACRKPDRRPLHHGFVRHWRRHTFRMAFADADHPRISGIGAVAGAIGLARALRGAWDGQPRVGILLPAGAAAALVNVAASIGGRASVNLNFTAGGAAMESATGQAGLRTVVTSRLFLERIKVDLPPGVEPIWLEDVAAAGGVVGRITSLVLAALAPVRLLERLAGATRRPTIDDPVTVVFTSGSTGEPKGVVLSHFNVDSNVEAIAQLFRSRPDDRLLGILPPFHSFGYMSLWLASRYGIGTVAHPNPLDAATIGALAEHHGATVLLATPTLLRVYMRRCTPAHLGSLRLVLAGGEALPAALADSFEDHFGLRPLEGYGLTECAPVIAVGTLDYRARGFFQPGSKRGFVGQPLPGVSLRVVDPETFEVLDPGREGLLLVKGPNVMNGYLGREDQTAAAFRDGWYVTGDVGLLDEDGFLKIVDRLSRFSKIGGEMVPHGRVEDALNQAAGAAAQVFAVTTVGDPLRGERLAVVHTADDEALDGVLAKLAADLPSLFIPRRDDFLKVPAIPMLGTGKPDLRAIRRVAEEGLTGSPPRGNGGPAISRESGIRLPSSPGREAMPDDQRTAAPALQYR